MDFPLPRAQDYFTRADEFITRRVLPELPGYLEAARRNRGRCPRSSRRSRPRPAPPDCGTCSARRPVRSWPVQHRLRPHCRTHRPGDAAGARGVQLQRPDTGNAEVLVHYGSEAQQEQWLAPLLAGEIRSAFCMTEPAVASSDASNMAATAVIDGDEVVINGTKWWSTGIGHPDCKFVIFMGLTDPEARVPAASMVLVPTDAPEWRSAACCRCSAITTSRTDTARCPSPMCACRSTRSSPDRAAGSRSPWDGWVRAGFIIACAPSVWPRWRWSSPVGGRWTGSFGKPPGQPRRQPGTHRGSPAGDRPGPAAGIAHRVAARPVRRGRCPQRGVADQGGRATDGVRRDRHGDPDPRRGRVSDVFPLAEAYAGARALRLADGPDEVHLGMVARAELKKYAEPGQ